MAYVNFQAPAQDGESVVQQVRDLLGKAAQTVKRDEASPDKVSVKTKKPDAVRQTLISAGYNCGG